MNNLEQELLDILPNIKLNQYNGALNGKYGGNCYGERDFDFNISSDGSLSIYYLENFDEETKIKLIKILEKYSMIFSGKDKPRYR